MANLFFTKKVESLKLNYLLKIFNFKDSTFFVKILIFDSFILRDLSCNSLKKKIDLPYLILLDLKGMNYRFWVNKQKILLDLGFSHYVIFKFLKNIFKKIFIKGTKKFFFLNWNSKNFISLTNYFRYKLRPVGPYKLKGFSYVNENIILKEGKKPFQ